MIEAVIFDYGLVLSGPRAPWAVDAALRLSGFAREQFEEVYWKFREAYDEGSLDGTEYWRKSLEDAGIVATPELVREMVRLDGAMWCTRNEALAPWHERLHATGVKTAILSNMGDAVRAAIERECAWVHAFEVRVWSHELRCAKPERRIYDTVLARLEMALKQVLFLEDREQNVTAACRCGMHGLVYDSIEQLRDDLQRANADFKLPLA